MGDSDDLRQLRAVLQQATKACKLPVRKIEDALGISHGALGKLLDGSIELRVRHLLAFARLLQVPPHDFLEIACSPEGGTKFRLREWITPREFAPPHAEKKTGGPTEELPALIRKAVREELSGELKKTIRTVVREELTRSETSATRSESN